MKDVTIVTGPLRSGTSCVTGLLVLCGFDLGRNVRILRDPTPMNPRGHFEPDLLFAINERLLQESGKKNGIFSPPAGADLLNLAAQRERYFRLFMRKFDGELCKDPLLCLTIAAWKKFWPELQRAVFCLRHPLAVAASMRDRYGLPLPEGVSLWHTYTRSFVENSARIAVYLFDFDQFCRQPVSTFAHLLEGLGRPLATEILRDHIEAFFHPPYAEWNFDALIWRESPSQVKDLYYALRNIANDHTDPKKPLGFRLVEGGARL